MQIRAVVICLFAYSSARQYCIPRHSRHGFAFGKPALFRHLEMGDGSRKFIDQVKMAAVRRKFAQARAVSGAYGDGIFFLWHHAVFPNPIRP